MSVIPESRTTLLPPSVSLGRRFSALTCCVMPVGKPPLRNLQISLPESPQEATPPPSPVLPDFAQGIPEGAQVPLLRPTVEDARRLVETAKAALADAKTALKWNTLRSQRPHMQNGPRCGKRIHQYQLEMPPGDEGLLSRQLGDLTNLQIARYLSGLNLNQSPASKAEGLADSINAFLQGQSITPGQSARRGEALLRRAEPLLTDEWLDTRLHDRLAKGVTALRQRLTPAQPPVVPSAPAAPPAPPVGPRTPPVPPVPPTEKEALRQRLVDAYMARNPKMVSDHPSGNVARLLSVITSGTYGEIVHPDNAVSRKVFTEVTGVKLPGTVSGTKALFTGTPFPLKGVVPSAPPIPPAPPSVDEPPSLVRQAVMDAYARHRSTQPPAELARDVTALTAAIETGTYTDLLAGQTGLARRIFWELTGVKLPDLAKPRRALFTGKHLFR